MKILRKGVGPMTILKKNPLSAALTAWVWWVSSENSKYQLVSIRSNNLLLGTPGSAGFYKSASIYEQ